MIEENAEVHASKLHVSMQQLKLENELLQGRIALIMSLIQPHFLFNALPAIKELCKTDHGMAEETIVEFAEYLRGNMDSLMIIEPIPFEKELRHVKNYLAIEKKRFGEKLRIKYDIAVKDFKLPTLTLGSVVENAVRYSICKKDSGGTLKIKTEWLDNFAKDYVVITVTDDGEVFDEQISRKRIDHIHKRLEVMCGGTLSVTSNPGMGNVVVMIIPIISIVDGKALNKAKGEYIKP